MSDCRNNDKNLKVCNCSYSGCPRKGICCECLQYHLSKEQVPACFFDKKAEATYDRSIEHFIATKKK